MTWHVEYNNRRWLEGGWDQLYACANFIAHLANPGCLDESVIHNDILQSLTSHPKLYNHQADGLIILFKLVGTTFEKYGDPSVVDRCFELLEGQYRNNAVKGPLIQMHVVSRNKGCDLVNTNFQDICVLQKCGWDGLPPPPVLATRKLKLMDQKDSTATPIITSLGLPNGDPEPWIPQPQCSPVDPVTTPETDLIPATPDIQSLSISIATLSNFTVAGTSDDESPPTPQS